jgi:hypothetical protein
MTTRVSPAAMIHTASPVEDVTYRCQKVCAAVIAAAHGSASAGRALRAIDPTVGTTLTIGRPITLCGSEKRHAVIELAPGRGAIGVIAQEVEEKR